MTLRDKDGYEVTEAGVPGYVEVDMGMGEKGYICQRYYRLSFRLSYNIQLKICRDLGFEGV